MLDMRFIKIANLVTKPPALFQETSTPPTLATVNTISEASGISRVLRSNNLSRPKVSEPLNVLQVSFPRPKGSYLTIKRKKPSLQHRLSRL